MRLERQSNKDVAQELELSYDGVRSRIRRIFGKLGTHRRLDAVRRARGSRHPATRREALSRAVAALAQACPGARTQERHTNVGVL